MRAKITIPILIGFSIGIISLFAIYTSSYKGLEKDAATFSRHTKSCEYLIKGYSVKFEVPHFTEVQVDPDIEGSEILFSIYYTNNKLAYRGYIQLWKIESLKEFLDHSKYLSPFDFIFYKMDNIKLNYYQGYIIEWTTVHGQQVRSGKDYWLNINNTNEVVRVSFITDKENFPSDLTNIIQQTLYSLQIK
ncbi:hypothetical protein Sgly_0287 [Syntrophobotulus glycolicus DSM 8271]|uniref:Uncharacterized protein n=1 Tax=Syntrophobotulus glycolicus (strain DSM 8271 / FlGlyR) TaxID=645991 RepID=F0SWW5_SYNGF|nr:hypothetical protein [Syntrophobotulus glycolicus]ADY54655.1 hypothetical protein Sgly_0287 [Syntrophobotulus glycolicus DSM 8271]